MNRPAQPETAQSALHDGDRSALAAIANAIPQIVWVADAAGRIFYYNDMWYETTGFEAATIATERDWTEVIHPDDLEETLTTWHESVASGIAFESEFRLRHVRTTTYRWVLGRGRPLRDREGRIVRWFGTTNDIDVQKRYREASTERDAQLRRIASTLPHMVYTATPSGAFDYFSDSFVAYAGAAGRDLLRDGLKTIAHPDDLPSFEERWRTAYASGSPHEAEIRLLGASDNAYRWFLLRTLPYVGPGGIEAWIGTATDVDPQKRRADRRESVIESLVDALVPTHLPDYPPFRLDAVYVPAEEDARVGGDFFDVIEMPDGPLLVTIGDVAGHGTDAAVVMARAGNAVVSSALDISDPAEILERANRVLRLSDETMVTAFVGLLDRTSGTFTYATAGHCAPIVVSRKRPPRFLAGTGTPLGILPAIATKTFADVIEPGEMLLLYTDGIVEYDRDLFSGEIRLVAATEASLGHAEPARSILRTILGTRRAPDDVALLTLSHVAASAPQ